MHTQELAAVPSPATSRAHWIAAAVSLALLFSSVSGGLLRPLLRGTAAAHVPYLGSALVSLADVLALLLLVSLAARCLPTRVVALTGWNGDLWAPLRWIALVMAPALLGALIWLPVSGDFGPPDLLWKGIAGPAVEEFFYRGLAVGVLMRLCGWRWWSACLWPALFFGIAHLWQGSEWLDTAAVVVITALGGLLFGWLFARWRFNLWPPVLLHVGMNSLWLVFAMGETAIGGWLGNALRLAIVVLAIVLTWRMAPER